MREDPWALTSTGRRVDLLCPDPESIEIDDIAHGLSRTCRFCGQAPQTYTVAQHSCLVSELVHPDFALQGLLHDATEAYLGDLNGTLKRHALLAGYRMIEEGLREAICRRFAIDVELPPEVRRADQVALYNEKRALFPSAAAWPGESVCEFIELDLSDPWWPAQAKALFLSRFDELVGSVTQNRSGV